MENIKQPKNLRNELRGTWVCPDIAIHLAMWLSPRWAVEVIRVVRATANETSGFYEEMLMRVEEEGAKTTVREGYIYILTAPHFTAVKIGSWMGTLEALKRRYRTCFTSDLVLRHRLVNDAKGAEQALLSSLSEYKIEGEVFRKECWDVAQLYLEEL